MLWELAINWDMESVRNFQVVIETRKAPKGAIVHCGIQPPIEEPFVPINVKGSLLLEPLPLRKTIPTCLTNSMSI